MSLETVALTRRRALSAGFATLTAPALLPGLGSRAEAKAAMLGAAESPFRRFRLGDFEVVVLSDGGAMVDGPWPIVGEDRPRDEVEQLMRDSLLPPSKFRPGFSPTLVNTGRELVLIDTGNGAGGFIPRPQAGRLVESLKAAGYRPEDIDVVALTHLHVDHMGGVMEGGVVVFPNARYAVGAVEWDFWKQDERLAAPPESNENKSARMFRGSMLPLADRTTFLKAGEDVVSGITAVAAFGHTPGHFGYHVESAGQRLLAWGDCAHHEVASLAHPEWSALFDQDKEAGKATRRRIYEMAASERLPVLGYHTSFPSLGMIERNGAAFRWLPVTYQFAG